MEQNISFGFTALNRERFLPQVSLALERRNEVLCRKKCPGMWELTDRLNSVEKAPQSVRENRRKRRGFWGLLNWIYGLCLLLAGAMDGAGLTFLSVIGAVCFGTGVGLLWRCQRQGLAILSLLQGGGFLLGALWMPDGMADLRFWGIAGVTIGVLALLTRKSWRQDPFDRAARKLLEGKEASMGTEQMTLTFFREGIVVQWGEEGEERRDISYAEFEMVLETEDLLLLVYRNAVTFLQKADLYHGSMEELRDLLRGETEYIAVTAPLANGARL